MADNLIIVPLWSEPGVKRDGTELEGDNSVSAQWARWQRGRPRKQGGYRRMTNLLGGISRGLNVFDLNNETYTHSGSASALEQFTIDPDGVVSAIVNRTPAAYTASTNNAWQFDQLYDVNSAAVTLLAHAAPYLNDLSSNTAYPVWYGGITANIPLVASASPNVSGGVVVLHPYAFTFGSDGVVNWSIPDDPTDFSGTGSGSARVTGSKIVRGMALRGGSGNSPAGLFWSLDSLIRATFVGSTAGYFAFDTITSQSSILSAASVIEDQGIYYWIAKDRFMMFNGVVREIPNDMNQNWFFDNLNQNAQAKVFAYKIPRYGEIWWCYPRGSATECTHAIILNTRETQKSGKPVWYDTELPNSGRSAAQFAQVFHSPIMAGVDPIVVSGATKYKLWQHEFLTDEIDGTNILAIQAFYESQDYNPQMFQLPGATSLCLECFEPDYIQSGDLMIQAFGRWNARSPEIQGTAKTFVEDTGSLTADEQVTPMRENMRQMRFRIESNVVGGNFEEGEPYLHFRPGDSTIRS